MEPVDSVRTQIALLPAITEQHLAVAPSKKKSGAQPRGSAANNENID
jgi:hypothetical protein